MRYLYCNWGNQCHFSKRIFVVFENKDQITGNNKPVVYHGKKYRTLKNRKIEKQKSEKLPKILKKLFTQ